MKTSQVSKDTSADERSELGVCNSQPWHPRSSLLHGDFEMAGSKVTGNSLVSFLRHSDAFLQMLKRQTSQTLLGLIEPLCWFFTPFSLFLAAQFKVKYIKKKKKSMQKEKKGWGGVEVGGVGTTLQKTDPQNNSTFLLRQNIGSQRARRSAWQCLWRQGHWWKMKGHEKYSSTTPQKMHPFP